MVAFIEDQEAVAVAPALDMNVGRIVRRDGQRLQVIIAAAEQTDRDTEGQGEFAVPLIEQVDSGRDHQRGTLGALDGEDGKVRFAGAGRQHDDAARALGPPGFERLGLVRKRLALGLERPRVRLIVAGLVSIGKLAAAQVLNNGAVMVGLSAVLIRARVEATARQRLEVRARYDERSLVEAELEGFRLHAKHYGPSRGAMRRRIGLN